MVIAWPAEPFSLHGQITSTCYVSRYYVELTGSVDARGGWGGNPGYAIMLGLPHLPKPSGCP